MTELGIIMLGAIITNNFVLVKFLGICPFLGVSRRIDSALGMSFAVIFVMVLATIVTYPIHIGILAKNNIEYLQTLVFILVIASLVQLVEIVMKKYTPALHKGLGVFLPLITTNCAVLGVCILNINEKFTFTQSVMNAFGAGLGFLLALIMFAGVRKRIENNDFPISFKGVPSVLVAAAIVSLSFMGFGGVINGLFGV